MQIYLVKCPQGEYEISFTSQRKRMYSVRWQCNYYCMVTEFQLSTLLPETSKCHLCFQRNCSSADFLMRLWLPLRVHRYLKFPLSLQQPYSASLKLHLRVFLPLSLYSPSQCFPNNKLPPPAPDFLFKNAVHPACFQSLLLPASAMNEAKFNLLCPAVPYTHNLPFTPYGNEIDLRPSSPLDFKAKVKGGLNSEKCSVSSVCFFERVNCPCFVCSMVTQLFTGATVLQPPNTTSQLPSRR